ncbi:FG-GAP repeat domain-containing protein [Thermodesulfobacteriota bacterium]
MQKPLYCLMLLCVFTALSCCEPPDPPAPACAPADNGSGTVAAPELLATLSDRYQNAWLSSPAVADLDSDGQMEIIVARSNLVNVWHLDNTLVLQLETRSSGSSRIWAPPVVADIVPARPGLEIAVAAREKIYVWDAQGNEVSGFPVTWKDEVRSLAAGDIDGDGALELVAGTIMQAESDNGQEEPLIAYNHDGSVVKGFPPNATGSGGCDENCWVFPGVDQNIAIGDVNADGRLDILSGQDNAYLSLLDGGGTYFDAADIFEGISKFPGIRFLHDYEEAIQHYSSDKENALQSHFTHSSPAIADIDGDGTNELVILAAVTNVSQSNRDLGVALWVLHSDGSRHPDWTEPFYVPEFLDGLVDLGDNIVAATNQVTVADINPESAGPELLFAGVDGLIHCVSAARRELWSYTYTRSKGVLTGGVTVADLSGDGVPEIVFASYSTKEKASHLFILDAGGALLHKTALPGRGVMPVPTIADADGNGTLEIILSLKDGEDRVQQVLVYTVPGSSENCLLWPTGRCNYLRNGDVSSL